MSCWIIVYQWNDRSKLDVIEIAPGHDHEIADYAIASSRRFHDGEHGDGVGASAAWEHLEVLAARHDSPHRNGMLD